MKTIIHFAVSAVAILITAYLLPGVMVDGPLAAFVLAIVLAIINTVLKPILVMLTLPITVVSLGLFVLVINALLVMLASAVVPGFSVASFWSALLFGLVLTVINWGLRMFDPKN